MECVYVAMSTYGKSREQIAGALSALLNKDKVVYVSNLACVYFPIFTTTTLDLADCYLISLALQTKQELKTFDKKMLKIYNTEKAKL